MAHGPNCYRTRFLVSQSEKPKHISWSGRVKDKESNQGHLIWTSCAKLSPASGHPGMAGQQLSLFVRCFVLLVSLFATLAVPTCAWRPLSWPRCPPPPAPPPSPGAAGCSPAHSLTTSSTTTTIYKPSKLTPPPQPTSPPPPLAMHSKFWMIGKFQNQK